MYRSLIITVAGMSSRFNKDLDGDVLKCLYFEDIPSNSLLRIQIHKTVGLVDEIIIVGGYKYEDLEWVVHEQMTEICSKLKLVYNDHYYDYGSGYSLLKGIEAVSDKATEIIFIEGDLFFDSESISNIIQSTKDVISVNKEPILSDKAVVLYFDTNYFPHYIYDTKHACLEIHEPFTAIYNSGQMWKFRNPKRVREVCRLLTDKQKQGTNLEIIQQYFGNSNKTLLDIISIKSWYNCNTVSDYREAIKSMLLK